jgi:hypothetical protein
MVPADDEPHLAQRAKSMLGSSLTRQDWILKGTEMVKRCRVIIDYRACRRVVQLSYHGFVTTL